MQTYLEKHIPAKNVARFYRLAVLPNLFGEWTLVREWGRIGQGGRIRLDCFATHEQALAALLALEARKRQRLLGRTAATGYVLIRDQGTWSARKPDLKSEP